MIRHVLLVLLRLAWAVGMLAPGAPRIGGTGDTGGTGGAGGIGGTSVAGTVVPLTARPAGARRDGAGVAVVLAPRNASVRLVRPHRPPFWPAALERQMGRRLVVSRRRRVKR